MRSRALQKRCKLLPVPEIEMRFLICQTYRLNPRNRCSSGDVTYRDVDSDWKMAFPVWLAHTKKYNHSATLHLQWHLNLNSFGTNWDLGPGSVGAVSSVSLERNLEIEVTLELHPLGPTPNN
jgi:hypothetical protein